MYKVPSGFYYDYPIGPLGIMEEEGSISGVFFRDKKISPVLNAVLVNAMSTKAPFANVAIAETPLIKKTAAQLKEYFAGTRKVFDIPLLLRGTDFQVAVWNVLQKIPYGKTCTYKDIATLAGNPKACRAAGMANNRNPIVIIVPCHRVIGSDGSLTGYGGGLEVKEYLLKLEGEKKKTTE